MKYLITGGCGFLGSNLAGEVINRGEELVVFDNLRHSGKSEFAQHYRINKIAQIKQQKHNCALYPLKLE